MPASSPAPSAGAEAPAAAKKTRQHWPLEVKSGSVVVKVRPSPKKRPDGRPRFFYVIYHLPKGRQVDQRGTLERAKEHAQLVADSIAAGEVEAAEMSKQDRLELLALRERAAAFNMQPLMALEEWAKARSMVGGEVIPACEAWQRRLTKFTRISVVECIKLFKAAYVKHRRARIPAGTSQADAEKLLLPKSYATVFTQFEEKFGSRYMDDIKKAELEAWFTTKGQNSGWTANTYRKRIVTLFHWARDNENLPRDQVTEADMTGRSDEEAPRRELTSPETLARILLFLQYGVDILNPEKLYQPRPELVPPVVLSAFSGYRSVEGDAQIWEDLDLEETVGNVTKAKRGTMADRPTFLPKCAIEWLKLTPAAERTGPLHGYKTEIHTIIRGHLSRQLGLKLPPNTLRKSWESYRVILSEDEGAAAAEEAGHSVNVSVKHYRNARAKRSTAQAWFEISPEALDVFRSEVRARGKAAPTLSEFLRKRGEVKTPTHAHPRATESRGPAPAQPPISDYSEKMRYLRSNGVDISEAAEWLDGIPHPRN